MGMTNEIRYTEKDGKPGDYGLGDKWVQEPFDPSEFQEDSRQKLRLIGEIIMDATKKGMAASTAAQLFHQALVKGEIRASGRFRATAYNENDDAVIIETPFRAIVPLEAVAPLYQNETHEKCLIVFDYEENEYNEFSDFDWVDSSIEYLAHGVGTDNQITFTPWVCRWSSIMVNPDQANKILAKTDKSFRRNVRPGAMRPIKTDEEILAKADEMKAAGMHGTTIAREMRNEPGFENVQTIDVRDLIKGRFKQGARKL